MIKERRTEEFGRDKLSPGGYPSLAGANEQPVSEEGRAIARRRTHRGKRADACGEGRGGVTNYYQVNRKFF